MDVFFVVCCQVEVSATGRCLVHRSPTECVCVIRCNSNPLSTVAHIRFSNVR
jgi:hypothetical protein